MAFQDVSTGNIPMILLDACINANRAKFHKDI